MAIKHQRTITVEEYFQLEENDLDTRYEYIDGYVYAMAGVTANHDTIKSNIQRILSFADVYTDVEFEGPTGEPNL